MNNQKDYLKHVSKLNFVSAKLFAKNYAAIHENKPASTFNKPVYVWFTVLESSKWLMYDFHYNFIKKSDMKFDVIPNRLDTWCLF